MRRINLPLVAGVIICAVLVLFMAAPGLLASNSPYTIQVMRSYFEEGSLRFETAPYPPSAEFPLGTDDHGRDIWSHIVHGTRLTITLALLIVLGRFAIALPVAMAAAFGNTFSRSLVRQFGILFSAIPALLISVIVLKQDLFASMDKGQSIFAFVVVLSLVGWAKLGTLILERTEAILRQPFIRSEVAIGKRPLRIATENVVPHLAPELVVLVFMEIARALAILMQLGIFGVFVGNLRIIESTDEGTISVFNTSFEPEWASMLGTAGQMINSAPWTVIFPALAFFVSVFGFNLLGEGLRNSLQGDSGFIPALRRLFRFDLIALWRSASKASRTALFVITGALVVILALPAILQSGRYEFASDRHLPGLPPSVLTGTDDARRTADLIRDRMISLGVEPLDEDGYYFDYEVPPSSIPSSQEFVVATGGTGPTARLTPVIGTDYSFLALGDTRAEGLLYDASRDDLLAVADYGAFRDRFVLIDKAFYSASSVRHIVAGLQEHGDVRGILLIARPGEPMTHSISQTEGHGYVLLLSRSFGERLAGQQGSRLAVTARAEPLGTGGRNVVGILRGNDPAMDDEALLIGIPYNYTAALGAEGLTFGLELMQRCAGQESRRSFIFAFLDGTLNDDHHGLVALMDDISYDSTDIELYLDLTGVHDPFGSLVYSSIQAPITRYYAWTFAHQLESQFDRRRFTTRALPAVNRGGEYYFTDTAVRNLTFWGYGIATVIVGTEPSADAGRGRRSDDLGSVLLRTIEMNNQ